MSITAIALLTVERTALPPDLALRIDVLDDALLLHLDEDFGSEPETLSLTTRAVVGEALEAQHQDPRGIFFLPSVAAPSGRTYEAVVAEIGEGGVWGPLPTVLEDDDSDALGNLLGNLLGQMPPSLLGAAQAAAAGNHDALAAMGAHMQALMDSSPALKGLAEQLTGMLPQSPGQGVGANLPSPAQLEQMMKGGQLPDPAQLAQMMQGGQLPDPAELQQLLGSAGIDLSSPAFAALAGQMQDSLGSDPDALRRLTEQFLGGAASEDDADRKKR